MVMLVLRLVTLFLPKRRWVQFSVGTLFVAVAAFAISCGLLARRIEQKRRERVAVGGERITNASLPQLRHLTNLRRLVLSQTRITDSRIDGLRFRELRDCTITTPMPGF